MKMKSLVCSCALMAGLSGFAQAHEDVDNSGKFNVLFGGGKYFTDDGSVDNGNVAEIGLGYIIDKHWAVEAIYSDISSIEHDTINADIDVEMFRIDGLYHFDQRGHWTPYLAAGIGRLKGDVSLGNIDIDGSETAYNLGGGVKYALSKALTARADVRAISQDGDLDTLATIGFNYIFGATSAAPAPAPAPEAPLDSDGDGVIDANDKCPGTAQGLVVDSDGCPRMEVDSVSIDLEVLFDTNKADVKPAYMPEIQRVADFMTTYPKTTAVIEGHTDSRGKAEYNLDLSQRRADAVRAVLVNELKVDAARVTAKGFGEEQPRASNDTVEGQQQNRRVTAVISASVEKLMRK